MCKKIIALLLSLLLLCLTAAAFASEAVLTLRDVTPEDNYKIKLIRKIMLAPPNELATRNYHVQQGATTDGEFAYMIMENQVDHLCSIWKVNMQDWTVADTVYGLDLSHGNCMGYNPARKQLVVVHNKPRYNTLSFVDTDTLQIAETVQLNQDMYAIGYCESRDQYVVGISGTFNFMILDGQLNKVAYYYGKDTGLVKQGVDCDDKYIYFPQNNKDCTVNQIVIYDWDGNYINTVRVGSFQEIEDVFHVGDDLYIAFNASGSYVYQGRLEEIKQ